MCNFLSVLPGFVKITEPKIKKKEMHSSNSGGGTYRRFTFTQQQYESKAEVLKMFSFYLRNCT